jgi:dTMP kinase
MFITFEGIDLSGKSTQALHLVTRLKEGRASSGAVPVVRFLREPGGTPISERLREILLDRKYTELNPWAELFLFSAARAQLVSEVIRPALKRGEIVVCDRFYDSTTAYQGYGRGLDLETVRRINMAATGGTDPDLTIVVDIPVEEIGRRRRALGSGPDRMEDAGKEFFDRVRKGYAEIIRHEPHRVVCVDGTGSVRQVEDEVWRAVARLREVTQQSVQG